MTEETRNRALMALEKARVASSTDWYFQRVFVIGNHIFFTFMAAVRMRNTIRYERGIELPIEKVDCPHKLHVNKSEMQRGALMRGEYFPNKEYAELIAS